MAEIGDKIRKIRIQRGLTIQAVSEATELSASFISRMERGDINPSLSSIKKIADALGISIGHLFDDRPYGAAAEAGLSQGDSAEGGVQMTEIEVVRKNERRKLVYPGQHTYDYLLTPTIRNVGIEFILTVLEPGGSSGDEFYSHEGEECILVIKGILRLFIGEGEYILREGDSIHFKSTIPHRYTNGGAGQVEAVWATVPPTF